MARMIRIFNLPSHTSIHGLREMEEKDVPAVHTLWQKFMACFDMVPDVTEEEVQHYLLSGRGEGELKNRRREGQVVWSYVVEVSLSSNIYIYGFVRKLNTLLVGPGHPSDHGLLLFLHLAVFSNQQYKAPLPGRGLSILLRDRDSFGAKRTVEWCPEEAIVSADRGRSHHRITGTLPNGPARFIVRSELISLNRPSLTSSMRLLSCSTTSSCRTSSLALEMDCSTIICTIGVPRR